MVRYGKIWSKKVRYGKLAVIQEATNQWLFQGQKQTAVTSMFCNGMDPPANLFNAWESGRAVWGIRESHSWNVSTESLHKMIKRIPIAIDSQMIPRVDLVLEETLLEWSNGSKHSMFPLKSRTRLIVNPLGRRPLLRLLWLPPLHWQPGRFAQKRGIPKQCHSNEGKWW